MLASWVAEKTAGRSGQNAQAADVSRRAMVDREPIWSEDRQRPELASGITDYQYKPLH
jgi:hypothetical protein